MRVQTQWGKSPTLLMQNLPIFTSFLHYHLLDFPVARWGIKHSKVPVGDKERSACRKDVCERTALMQGHPAAALIPNIKKLLFKRLFWSQAHPSSRLWSRGHQAGPALLSHPSVCTILRRAAPLQLRLFSAGELKQRLSKVCLKLLGCCFSRQHGSAVGNFSFLSALQGSA